MSTLLPVILMILPPFFPLVMEFVPPAGCRKKDYTPSKGI
jgi:hypothetical protein